MEQQIKLLRVFIASPGDLGDERRALRDVVEKVNAIFCKETEWRIELLGWEDTLPGAGRPQELINADLDKADLFVGCVWQRWGSIAGSDGKTGFEEEFDRALERRANRGSPEMWLFFKQVDPVTRGDPGPQLQKVLAFRSREIEAKRLLFRDFRDTGAWREMVFELLHRQMLRLVTARPIVAKDVQSTGTPQSDVQTNETAEESRRSQPKSPSALASLAEILKHAEQKVRGGKLGVFERSDALSSPETVRLLLFAATNYDWNGQHVQLGTHEINSVYFHRTALDPTALERLFVLRTMLLDEDLIKPGWFWVGRWKVQLDLWLPWFTLNDSEENMRVRGVEFATRIGFPLYKRRRKLESPISSVLSDQHASVRLAGLQHLATLGREADLPMIERILQDDNKDVRTEAERTMRLIRLRADPDGEVKKSIEQRDPFDEGIADAVVRTVEKISNTTLILALRHPSGELKAVAAKELLKRSVVSPDLARFMRSSEAKAVKECGFLAAVGHGEAIDTSNVRSAFQDDYGSYSSDVPWWNKADADVVVSAYFDRLSAEELWKRVYSFDADSHLALGAIGRHFFAENVARIRADLLHDFQNRADAAKPKAPELPGGPISPLLSFSLYGDPNALIESERKRVRITALQVLADHSDRDDRELFLKFLAADVGPFQQTIACLRGLSSVGTADDRSKFIPLLADPFPAVQAAAARAYLALSPNSVVGAKDLLGEPSEYRVWVVIRYALKSGERALWHLLEPLLGHENENVRRLVCYYAVSILKNKPAEKLLNEYLGRGHYYYNVVTLLDRALYAPKILRIAFLKQEREFFEKWRNGATSHWREQDG